MNEISSSVRMFTASMFRQDGYIFWCILHLCQGRDIVTTQVAELQVHVYQSTENTLLTQIAIQNALVTLASSLNTSMKSFLESGGRFCFKTGAHIGHGDKICAVQTVYSKSLSELFFTSQINRTFKTFYKYLLMNSQLVIGIGFVSCEVAGVQVCHI